MEKINASELVLSKLLRQKVLQCDSCHEQMELPPSPRSPKYLDCSHTYCSSCLESFITGTDIFSSIRCPCCDEETTVGAAGLSGLHHNLTIIRILDLFCDLEMINSASNDPPLNHSHIQETNHSHKQQEPNDLNENITITNSCQSEIHSNSKSQLTAPGKGRKGIHHVVMECPTLKLGKVIGVRGNNIKNIRSKSRCHIELKPISDDRIEDKSEIHFHGTLDQIADAKAMVSAALFPVLLTPCGGSNDSNDDFSSESSTPEPTTTTENGDNHKIHSKDYSSSSIDNRRHGNNNNNNDNNTTSSNWPHDNYDHNDNDSDNDTHNEKELPHFYQHDSHSHRNNNSSHTIPTTTSTTTIDNKNRLSKSNYTTATTTTTIIQPHTAKNTTNLTRHVQLSQSRSHSRSPQLVSLHSDLTSDDGNNDDDSADSYSHNDTNNSNYNTHRHHDTTSYSSTTTNNITISSSTNSTSKNLKYPFKSSSSSSSSGAGNNNSNGNGGSGTGGGSIGTSSSSSAVPQIVIDCRLEQIGRVIGLKGCRIKDMRSRSGARIEVLKGPPCRIEIFGDLEQITIAQSLIYHSLDREPPTTTPPLLPTLTTSTHNSTIDKQHIQDSSLNHSNHKNNNNINKNGSTGVSTSTSTSTSYLTNKRIQVQVESSDDEIYSPPTTTTATATTTMPTLDNNNNNNTNNNTNNNNNIAIYSYTNNTNTNTNTASTTDRFELTQIECPSYILNCFGKNNSLNMKDIKNLSGCDISVNDHHHQHHDTAIITLRGKSYQLASATELISDVIKQNTNTNIIISTTTTTTTTNNDNDDDMDISHNNSISYNQMEDKEQDREYYNDNNNSDNTTSKTTTHSKTNNIPISNEDTTKVNNTISRIDMYIPHDVVPLLINSHNQTILRDVREISGSEMKLDKGVYTAGSRRVKISGTITSVLCARDILARRLGIMDYRQLCDVSFEVDVDDNENDINSSSSTSKINSHIVPHSISTFLTHRAKRIHDEIFNGDDNEQELEHDIRSSTSYSPPHMESEPSFISKKKSYSSSNESNHNNINHHHHTTTSNSTTNTNTNQIEEVWECPHEKVAGIIGRRGTVVREIKRRSCCQITISNAVTPSKTIPGEDIQRFVYIGTREQINKAKGLIQSVMEIGAIEALEMSTDCVEFPHDKVALLIGANGATVKEIMRKTGCRITVNEVQEDRPIHIVDLIGTLQQIEHAKEFVLNIYTPSGHYAKTLNKTKSL